MIILRNPIKIEGSCTISTDYEIWGGEYSEAGDDLVIHSEFADNIPRFVELEVRLGDRTITGHFDQYGEFIES